MRTFFSQPSLSASLIKFQTLSLINLVPIFLIYFISCLMIDAIMIPRSYGHTFWFVNSFWDLSFDLSQLWVSARCVNNLNPLTILRLFFIIMKKPTQSWCQKAKCFSRAGWTF
jgi:hypothetical protein